MNATRATLPTHLLSSDEVIPVMFNSVLSKKFTLKKNILSETSSGYFIQCWHGPREGFSSIAWSRILICLWIFVGKCHSLMQPSQKQITSPVCNFRHRKNHIHFRNVLFSIPIDSLDKSNNPIGISESNNSRRNTALRTGWTQHDKDMMRQWSIQTVSIGIPALLGMMADPLLSLIDTAYVGKIGSLPLAALGTCTSVFHVAFNAFRGTTTVTTSLVATALATSSSSSTTPEDTSERNRVSYQNVNDEVRLIIQSSIRYGLTNGLMLALVLWNFGKLSLHIMGISSSSPLLDPAYTYLKIRALAAPAVLFIAVAEGAFRGFTDATTPLLASLIAAIINIILDPLMMFTMKMGVGGAAFATVISQYTAAIFYGICLFKRKMLLFSSMKFWKHVPFQQMWTWNVTEMKHGHIESDSKRISRTITQANISMLTKQGSLLFAWAYATACATRLGHFHVAAHQVALSLWLFFVLIIDGAAISAQILMSKTYGPLIRSSHSPSLTSVQTKIDEHTIRRNVQTLCYFMTFVSIIQGLLSTGAILWFGNFAPHLFTTDANIQTHLMALIPHLAWQQVLISLVLVLESLVVGANQFGLLAFGTTISTIVAVKNIHDATDIVSIWSRGIVSLFLGRLLTSIVGILNINGAFNRWKKEEVS